MPYVDGFVVVAPKSRIEDYKAVARLGCQVWMDHGAISYCESLAEDVPAGELTSFPKAVLAQPDETVVFSFVTYESRAHRDEVNARVMADPRMRIDNAPFDRLRMLLGGFETIVSA